MVNVCFHLSIAAPGPLLMVPVRDAPKPPICCIESEPAGISSGLL